MKKDNLEKFISENRQAFDDQIPSQRIWDNIDRSLYGRAQANVLPLRKVLMIAASTVVLMGIGVGFGAYWMKNSNDNQTNNLNALAEYQEYREAEQYYIQRVGNTWDEIKEYEDHQDVEQDLKHLDEVYLELKEELENSQSGDKDMIIQAMISNYQNKLKILERVRTKIDNKKIQNSKNTNNEDLKI